MSDFLVCFVEIETIKIMIFNKEISKEVKLGANATIYHHGHGKIHCSFRLSKCNISITILCPKKDISITIL